jgi:hypothetical protein
MKYFRLIVSILESLYLVYMFNFFKTTISFHHPFEILFTKFDYFKHPINTGSYENKICTFGKHLSYLGSLYLILRNIVHKLQKINKSIVYISIFLSFIMNINSFIYLVPIFITEYLFFKN